MAVLDGACVSVAPGGKAVRVALGGTAVLVEPGGTGVFVAGAVAVRWAVAVPVGVAVNAGAVGVAVPTGQSLMNTDRSSVSLIPGKHVQPPVAVEVAPQRGYWIDAGAEGKGRRRPERAVPVAEQNRYRIGQIVRRDKVGNRVAVEVAHRYEGRAGPLVLYVTGVPNVPSPVPRSTVRLLDGA